MNIAALLKKLLNSSSLSPDDMQEFMQACLSGQVADVQLAAFLALMQMKGESIEELTAAAKVLLSQALPIDLGDNLMDIVGTGGDARHSFNVSSVSSFVAAAAGLRVAKHGNRSASSRSGSSDFLLQAGFKLQLSTDALRQCLNECNITFLFAGHFHQALRHVQAVRQSLGIRSFFNLLGPLINPAHVKRQVVGVYAHHYLHPIAQVLANLGSERCLVVHAQDGLDEISISAKTDVVEYHQGQRREWTIDPRDYDCFHNSLDAIVVKSPAESLKMAESVFAGEKGPARDIVLLNTAAALYCAGACDDIACGITKAAAAIDEHKALQSFIQLRDLTQRLESHKHE